ncbi:MAG: protein-disulfide reductase DsbD family protein [Myxococcota bacterium]
MLFLLFFCFVHLSWAADNPFRLEIVPPQPADQALSFVIVVPQGHHVYRDMLKFKVLDNDGLQFDEPFLPAGDFVADPASPGSFRELYHDSPKVEMVFSGSEGVYHPKFEVTYQGCKEGLCYPPETEVHTVDLTVGKDQQVKVSKEILPVVDFSILSEGAVVRKVDSKGKPHPVVARLIVDREIIQAGQPFRLGVHLEQESGWHTYWKSPGDIGLPTSIEWTLPNGFMANEFQFPIPHRYEDAGIVSYGYDDQVLFFSEIDVPENFPEGVYDVKANVRWLVCKTQCIPGNAELSTQVTVKNAENQPNSFTGLFEHFESQHPTPPAEVDRFAIETALSVSAIQSEKPFQFAVYLNPMGGGALLPIQDKGTWPLVTPIINGQYFITETNVEQDKDGGILITYGAEAYEVFDLPSTDSIGVLVQIKDGSKWIKTEAELPLKWAESDTDVIQSQSPLFASNKSPPNDTVKGDIDSQAQIGSDGEVEQTANYWTMLFMAFVGGFILNGMPCVLPVALIKLYSIIKATGSTRRQIFIECQTYSVGVLMSFWVLAASLIIIRNTFEIPVGWGFQFQYPEFVVALATVVFVFGLSLFGLFEIPAFGANTAESMSNKDGLLGHFLTGVFTTLLATPCSAPFLGTGMGFAFSLPSSGLFIFFSAAGIGLAFPFVLLGFMPKLLDYLPKPGAWMGTFKTVMGFTLMATTVWLVDVVGGLLGREGVTNVLSYLMVVAVASWLFGHYGSVLESGRRQLTMLGFALSLSAFGGYYFLNFEIPTDEGRSREVQDTALSFDSEVPWQPFSDAAVQSLSDRVLFIDFTADWCLSCKVNEKTILNTETVRKAMKEHNVVPLKADWTRRDPEITAWLERYERAGVPFYIVIPPNGAPPIPLGELITPSSVVNALVQASE